MKITRGSTFVREPQKQTLCSQHIVRFCQRDYGNPPAPKPSDDPFPPKRWCNCGLCSVSVAHKEGGTKTWWFMVCCFHICLVCILVTVSCVFCFVFSPCALGLGCCLKTNINCPHVTVLKLNLVLNTVCWFQLDENLVHILMLVHCSALFFIFEYMHSICTNVSRPLSRRPVVFIIVRLELWRGLWCILTNMTQHKWSRAVKWQRTCWKL